MHAFSTYQSHGDIVPGQRCPRTRRERVGLRIQRRRSIEAWIPASRSSLSPILEPPVASVEVGSTGPSSEGPTNIRHFFIYDGLEVVLPL
jgi:hypothetical protein